MIQNSYNDGYDDGSHDAYNDGWNMGHIEGWDGAIAAIEQRLTKLPTYDENGYITKWADLTKALEELKIRK